jgi:hypothetical protein
LSCVANNRSPVISSESMQPTPLRLGEMR